jgi:hypothetical protein
MDVWGTFFVRKGDNLQIIGLFCCIQLAKTWHHQTEIDSVNYEKWLHGELIPNLQPKQETVIASQHYRNVQTGEN